MKQTIEKYLSPQQSEKLLNYLENQLALDVKKFEETFGYQGHATLVKWLLIHCLMEPKSIKLQPATGFILPRVSSIQLPHHFLNALTNNSLDRPHTIGNHYFEGFIPLFTPFFNVAGDGMGNFYFINFLHQQPDLIFYDHENPADSYQSLSLHQFMHHLPIKSFNELVEFVLAQKSESLGLNNLAHQDGFHVPNAILSQGPVFQFMSLLQRNTSLKQLAEQARENALQAPFLKEEVLTDLLTNKASDYYQYDHVRAVYNPLIIAHFYWYFLTGNFTALSQWLADTKEIKGSYYASIRAAFLMLSQGDLSRLTYSYAELSALRKGLNLPESKLLVYERTHFKEAIQKAAQQVAEQQQSEAAHQEDNYFLLLYGATRNDWALVPREKKYCIDHPLNNFKPWEHPEPMVCTLKNHNQPQGTPPLLADVLFWQTPITGFHFVVSEKLKNTLLQYHLPPHHFYEVHLEAHGTTNLYYAFVLSQDPNQIHYINFDKTVFYLETRRKPKYSVIGDIKFTDYPDFAKHRLEYISTGFELKIKNNTIYLNTDLDLFFYSTSFLVSNRLKKALQYHYTGAAFTHLKQFESSMPFTSVMLHTSNP